MTQKTKKVSQLVILCNTIRKLDQLKGQILKFLIQAKIIKFTFLKILSNIFLTSKFVN